jgi:hypothetical protein
VYSSDLLSHWAEIVGPDYARVTTPVKINFPYQPNEPRRKGGTLTVRLPKGLAMEFSFKTELIRARVNAFFGYEAFAKIALDQAGVAPPPLKKAKSLAPADLAKIKAQTADVENDELRAALESFGQALLSK